MDDGNAKQIRNKAQNKIKSMGAMLDIDPDGLLMWHAEMMLRARKLGIRK